MFCYRKEQLSLELDPGQLKFLFEKKSSIEVAEDPFTLSTTRPCRYTNIYRNHMTDNQ